MIPPVPVRQWVISLPKQLRGVLGDRPKAVAAVTRILLDEIETLLCLERLRCARPSRRSPSGMSASGGMRRPAGTPTLGTMIAAAPMQRLVPTTHPGLPGPS